MNSSESPIQNSYDAMQLHEGQFVYPYPRINFLELQNCAVIKNKIPFEVRRLNIVRIMHTKEYIKNEFPFKFCQV